MTINLIVHGTCSPNGLRFLLNKSTFVVELYFILGFKSVYILYLYFFNMRYCVLYTQLDWFSLFSL